MATQAKVLVTDERERPLSNVEVHCLERGSGRILQRAITGTSGIALFANMADNVPYQFRAMNYRPGGKGGNVRIKELPKTSQDDVVPPAVIPPDDGEEEDVTVPYLVFLSRPQSIEADTRSTLMTIERRDIEDTPLTVGDLTVYLYSTSPGAIFEIDDGFGGFTTVTSVTILSGNSTATFYYTDDTAGNPVLTASTEVLL